MLNRFATLVPSTLFIVAAVMCGGACGGGMRFEAINMERPGEGIGLPPPSDYRACYAGHAEGLDTSGDGKVDYIRVKDDGGRDVCHGVDSNHDGTIDQWDVMDANGQLAKRARDTNSDGRADERWTFDPTTQCATVFRDANGDGQADSPATSTCEPADLTPGGPASAPTAAPTAPAATPSASSAPSAPPDGPPVPPSSAKAPGGY